MNKKHGRLFKPQSGLNRRSITAASAKHFPKLGLEYFGGLLVGIIFLWAVPALAAGPLEDVFQRVGQAPWGEKQATVKKNLAASPLLANNNILMVADGALSSRSTLSYLFKSGALYNLAWYTVTPISDIKAARDLDSRLEKALKARYGKPKLNHTDGRPGDAKDAAKRKAGQDAAFAALKKAEQAKGSELSLEEMTKALSGSGQSLLDIMPTLFYSKISFWDGGDLWVYTNLLCSTDGNCYQHLQFVSKKQTQDEAYTPTPQKAFSYTPLDRDQDLVTKSNRSLK